MGGEAAAAMMGEGSAAMAGPAELDEAALELLDALEELEKRREELGQLLREGWLSLSQARYTLGCHRVSALQYGATMSPRVRVRHSQEGPPQFEEVPGMEPEEPQGGDGLRQRRAPPPSGGPAPSGGAAPSGGPAPPRPPPDPLSWFGVLVPPSLRQAQGHFRRGVSVAVALAGLQGVMAAAAQRYRQLKEGVAAPGDVTTPGDDVTPPRDDLTAPGDDLTCPIDDVTAPVDDVTGPGDDITAPRDDVTAPAYDITGEEEARQEAGPEEAPPPAL